MTTNWFDEAIKEQLNKEELDEVKPKAFNQEEMKKILSSFGYDMSDVSILNKNSCSEENIGKKICVKNSLVIAANIIIKTNYNLYKVAKVVLPQGYIGVIGGVDNNKYVVDFDANLSISPEDVSEGYDGSNITYPLDKFELAASEVQVL